MAEQATTSEAAVVEPGSSKEKSLPLDGLDGVNTIPQESKLETEVELLEHQIVGAWILPKNLWILLRHRAFPSVWRILTHGSTVDIHALQSGEAGTKDGERMRKIYERAKQYPNETEHLFSFMQVMTACTASFAHG